MSSITLIKKKKLPGNKSQLKDVGLLKTLLVKQTEKNLKEHFEQQIMDASINMDQYIHFTKGMGPQLFCKSWMFKKDAQVYKLEYTYGWQFRQFSGHMKPQTGWYKIDDWYLFEDRKADKIYNINDWIKDHQKYLEKYKTSNTLIQESLSSFESILGPISFSCLYEMGWGIKNEYQIIIDRFEFPEGIQVKFFSKKPNEKVMTQLEFTTFLNKNKKRIQKIIEQDKINYQHKQNNAKLEKLNLKTSLNVEPLDQDQRIINMMRARPGIDNAQLYKRNLKKSTLFINRSLKERYEIQACKPLPTPLSDSDHLDVSE
jgi:hypothetical protein